MPNPRNDLTETYRDMSDEELMERWGDGNLTEVAKTVAREELSRRKIEPLDVALADTADDETDTEENVSFVTVARSLIPSELHILHARLEGDGIPSYVVDDNLTQMNSLWSVAVGGARLLVSKELAEEAKQVIDLVKSGKFALQESDWEV